MMNNIFGCHQYTNRGIELDCKVPTYLLVISYLHILTHTALEFNFT